MTVFPLSPHAARPAEALERVIPEPPAGEVIDMQFGARVPVFGDVPFDSGVRRER